MNLSNDNFNVGVDIETIARFQDLDAVEDLDFLRKIFTSKEMKFCFAKENPAPHLAARYTAKEAIFKALSSLVKKSVTLNKIEILNQEGGMPEAYIESFEDTVHIKLSMSHCEDKAISFAIVSKV